MASSAFLRLEWTDAGTREAIAFAIHEQPQLRTIAWYVDAWRGEGVAVPPDAVAYVSARGGAPVPAPRSRLVQEDCEIRFELPESDIAMILEYTQSDGRRRHQQRGPGARAAQLVKGAGGPARVQGRPGGEEGFFSFSNNLILIF